MSAPTIDRTAGPLPEPVPGDPPAPPVPPAQGRPRPDRPRSTRTRTLDDRLSLVGSGLGALALVWLVYERLLVLHGVLGFVVSWFVAFLAVYAVVTALSHPRTVVLDRLATAAMYAGALVVGFALATVVTYTFLKGWHAITNRGFLVHDMSGVAPSAPLHLGGIKHAIIGTVIEVAIAVAISLPLGVGTAIYLNEVGGRLSVAVRTVVEAMTALPEILAGLFVYVTLVVGFGFPKTGFAVSVAMTITMVPIIARSGEVALRVVPGGLREAGLALGATHWRTVRMVVLPSARAGLATALILSIARGIGETAVPLILSGASTYTNTNPFVAPMNSLPLYIFEAVRSNEPIAIERGFGAAAVLLAAVLGLFVLIRFLARDRSSR